MTATAPPTDRGLLDWLSDFLEGVQFAADFAPAVASAGFTLGLNVVVLTIFVVFVHKADDGYLAKLTARVSRITVILT